jgi:predicted DNA-binding transcriptional regulator AlpA
MERLLTLEELQTRVKRGASTIRKDCREGRMPAPFRIGRELRWHAVVIEQWLASGCPPVRSDAAPVGSAPTLDIKT